MGLSTSAPVRTRLIPAVLLKPVVVDTHPRGSFAEAGALRALVRGDDPF